MPELSASRTLVKSPPELWEACSDVSVLGRHLEPFGEIRITRLEPETTVAWEGERASGTVRIEPSGWGTKVTLTADTPEPEPVVAATPPSEPSPPPEPPSSARRRRGGLLAWLLGREPAPEPERAPEPVQASEPVQAPESVQAPAPESPPEAEIAAAEATLAAALDSLGQAHHRPFSRG